MSAQVNHPIEKRWPTTRPDVMQLYAFPTPNGVKASIGRPGTRLFVP